VRHGSTPALEAGVHQRKEDTLSKSGVLQAKRVAERLKSANADLIISSRCKRAMQTAQAISKATGKRVIYTKLLNEKVAPSEVHGKKYGSKSELLILREMRAHASDPTWHYSDEENLFEERSRAINALKYLKFQKADTLIVVTHSNIMHMMLFVGIFGEDADVIGLFPVFNDNLRTHNASITECELDRDHFRLITFNDRAHLQ
jgi:broad specificity phosphatase PhoE